MILSLLMSCVTLDFVAFNGIPCSQVSTQTCEEKTKLDQICLECDQAYDVSKRTAWEDVYGHALTPLSDVEQVALTSTDGLATLDVYVAQSPSADPRFADLTVVYSHGNYASIEHYLPRIRALANQGVKVVYWDYRGYGKSLPASAPSAEQMIADSRLVASWAKTQASDPSSVVSYGYSLGAIAAVEMAHHDPSFCGLVLETPFTSMELITQSSVGLAFGERFFSEGRFDGERKLSEMNMPVFGLSAELDDKFPPWTIQALMDQAAGPVVYWEAEGAFHGVSSGGIVERHFDEYQERLGAFFASLPCTQADEG